MWQILQCAVQGRGHIKTGTPCQDKTYSLNKNGVYVIALADGAGSAKFSHFGAETVTRHICDILCTDFESLYNEKDGRIVKQKIIENILLKLNEEKEKHECELKDLASTLLVVAIKDNFFVLIHIGDGVIGYQKGNELKTASLPENGEFANTTVFTTSRDAITTMKIVKGELSNINGFVLMSDGSSESLYDKRTKTLPKIIQKMMYQCIILKSDLIHEQLLNTFENVIKMRTQDDCSIIMIVDDTQITRWHDMTVEERMFFLGIGGDNLTRHNKRQLKRYKQILKAASEPSTLSEISKRINWTKKPTMQILSKLMDLNLIIRDKKKYQTILKLD